MEDTVRLLLFLTHSLSHTLSLFHSLSLFKNDVSGFETYERSLF